MSKFNSAVKAPASKKADTVNYAGGEAFTQNAKNELAAILLTSMVKDQYYRGADDTLVRFKELLGSVDPKFAAKAAIFARDEFGMRSITHVAAAELAHRVKGESWTKDFFTKVVIRPDDMTETIAYYMANYGKPVPNSLKKGFAQAFDRFDGYNLAKYRAEDKAVSLVDVVNLVRPKPTERNADALRQLVAGKLRNTATWEARMSAAGKSGEKDAVWQSLMDEGRMPYFALLRNLRNIEQTGNRDLINRAAKQLVEDDPGKHRILPFRFLTAYGEVTDRTLVQAISVALDRATVNVPTLEGKTLIVVDHSGSMGSFSPGTPQFIGDTFAAVLYKSNDADVMVFGTSAGYVGTRGAMLNPDDSTMTLAGTIGSTPPPGGHGTNFHSIFEKAKDRYDRFVIFSDMQAWIGYTDPGSPLKSYEQKFKARPYIYSFDLGGYGTTQFAESRIMQLAGFSEKIFDTMKYVESDPNALVKRIEAVEL
jgi:60 kDa SS-A/Ro ribonucleoprotein